MTPFEKSIELMDKMSMINGHKNIYYKQCALIAVDELINEVYNISHQYTAVYDNETKFYNYTDSKELKFWKEVKKEIEIL